MKLWPANATAALSIKLGATGVLMFVFAVWVLPPIYDVFCQVTGLNGKTGGRYEAVDMREVDTSRSITVQFIAVNNEEMPWQFKPSVRSIKVHPGEQTRVDYLAVNPTNRDMIAQAIPSVVPFKASTYFHKTECFCFEQQPLQAGESAEMPMLFIVDQDLPPEVHTITLSYTLFDVTDRFGEQEQVSMTGNL